MECKMKLSKLREILNDFAKIYALNEYSITGRDAEVYIYDRTYSSRYELGNASLNYVPGDISIQLNLQNDDELERKAE